MNEPDSDAQRHLLERQIGEVEQRLGMLKEQIAAMAGDGGGREAQSGLMLPTIRALRCLELLRREIREDQASPAFQAGAWDRAG